MMRWIIGSSVRFRLLVVSLATALLAVGATRLGEMPTDVLPEFAPPTVEIQTEALGLSAPEVEQLITVPLEQDLLNGVAFLDDIRSESVPGLSRILLIFEPGTDLFRARQVVAERLTQAHALPQVSKPPQMLQPLSSTRRVMIIGVSSKGLSALEMSVLARWTIVPQLVGVPGVANIAIWGQQDRQLQVQVEPDRLRAHGVSLGQVIESTANSLWVSPLTFVEASTPGTGGFIDTPNQRLGIQHISPIRTPADLATVRVEDTKGKKLLLGDVATVVESHQPLIGDAVVNDRRGLLLVVEKFPEANSLRVTRGVEKALDTMRPGLTGVAFDTNVYRPASYIERSIDNLTLALVVGLGLIALVVGLFFLRWRTALITIVVIPLSLVVAVLVLYALGATMNPVVLAGLAAALLLVIDDAIVDIENIARRLRQQRRDGTDSSIAKTVLEASFQVRRATLFASLIIALALVPVFFLERTAGAFFPHLAAAYLVALATSMLVALTVTPALAMLLFSKAPLDGEESPLVRRLRNSYAAGLSRVIHRPRLTYLAVGVLLVATAAAMPFLKPSLLPTFREGELLVHWEGPPGTSLPEMNRITAVASRELRSVPGVRDVGAHVGRAVTGDQIVGANSGELWVSIDPGADYDATVSSIRRVLDGYPGLARHVQTYSQERVGEILAGTDEDVVVRLYGENLKILATEAEKLRGALSGIDGMAAAHAVLPAEEPTLEVQVDLAKAQRYAIKPGDVRRAATTLLSGIQVGSLFEQQKVFDVVVWGTAYTRNSLTSVRRLLIDTPTGGHVRLEDVADVRIAASPGVIKRQNVSRYVDVAANVDGRDRDAVVADVDRRLQDVALPIAYHAEVLSAKTQPTGRLISIGIAAAIGIFLLLQAFLGSWRLAALSFFTLPIAIAGGLLAALAAGGRLTLGSYIALFAVFGFATRSSVLLLDRFRQLHPRENDASGARSVQSGARQRLAPVVMTALATGLVFIPVLIIGGRPGYELLRPAAAVLLGGLVTSVLLTLFVLPVLYLRFGLSREAEGPAAPAPEELAAVLQERAGSGVLGGGVVTRTQARPEGGSQ
jgi:CzcA family heavy metal efflux pump